MSATDDNLDATEAGEARNNVAFCRSKYPSICANWLQRSVKNEVRTSMTFAASLGNDCDTHKCKYENEAAVEELGLRRRVGLSYEETKGLEHQMNQISAALDMVSKNKSCKINRTSSNTRRE